MEVTETLHHERRFSEAEIRRFYAEGWRAIAALERREAPFNHEWTAWKPDPAWQSPVLPEGWEAVPGVKTNLNHGHQWWWRWPV